MKKRLVFPALAATPLALFASSPAHAQDAAKPKPYSAQIGAAFLLDGDAKDLTQNVGFHIGLGYRLPMKSLISKTTGRSDVEVNYTRHSGDGTLDTFGIFYTERIPFSAPDPAKKGVSFYGGVGLGLAIPHLKFKKASSTGGSNNGSNNGSNVADARSRGRQAATTVDIDTTKTNLGGRLLLGAALPSGFFAEAAYQLNGSVEGIRADSVNLSLGIRF